MSTAREEGTKGKKTYTTPRLRRYGDFRTLTQGGAKKKDETNRITGPKTRPSQA